MEFKKVERLLKGIPYTDPERGKYLYNFIMKNQPDNCLELGFAHGVASCYVAAALDEIGKGQLTCVDLNSSKDLKPNVEELLQKTGLSHLVNVHREVNSYTWWLKKEIEKNTTDYVCNPRYDFCFIDGPKNWTIDGLAFFLVDKLLCQDGYICFDDYRWVYSTYSKKILDGITIREMSDDQITQPNIELVFNLLVMQHPDYSNFVIDEDWVWAQKTKRDTERKYIRFIVTHSFKYRILKNIKAIRAIIWKNRRKTS
jgi:predicted O-methyltransferase YrrM